MLNKVKLALRISHNFLDNDIEDTIKTARAELIRSGVSEPLAMSEENELVEMAIKTYCQYVYSDDTKKAERFFQSWTYQLDNIRKSVSLNV